MPTTFYSQKNAGLNDVMELYLYDFKKYPVFDKQAFSNFCKDKSSKFKGVWLYIVVFDNDKYAEFNQYPLSTQFDLGLDDDKVNIQIKHIKAIYRYNTKNEYVDIEYPNS